MKLGDRVTFTAVVDRFRDIDGKVTWERSDHPTKEGVLMGLRTVKIGTIVRESDWDDFGGRTSYWYEFHQTGSLRVALVVTNIYQNPVRVPLDAITPEQTWELIDLAVGSLSEPSRTT